MRLCWRKYCAETDEEREEGKIATWGFTRRNPTIAPCLASIATEFAPKSPHKPADPSV